VQRQTTLNWGSLLASANPKKDSLGSFLFLLIPHVKEIRASVKEIHTCVATSNLALHPHLAHHRQGGGSRSTESNLAHKSFALKILTSKLFAIKILQTLFANPAPSKPFRGMGGGDALKVTRIYQELDLPALSKSAATLQLFRADFHRTDLKRTGETENC
jgi:hypothetical protein